MFTFTFLLFGSDKKILLTKNEQEWINKKYLVTYVYDIDWAPFEFKNEVHRHSGIIADILQLISKKSGIKFEAIDTRNWEQAVLLAQNHKVDMYSAIPFDEKRAKYINDR